MITTAALVIILSAMNGLTDTVANLYNAFEPDLRVSPAKGKHFTAGEDMISKIRTVSGVEHVSRSISDKALIRNGERQALCTVKGVDASFSKVTGIRTTIVDGEYPLDKPDGNKIILGRGVADQLRVSMYVFTNEVSLFSPVRGKAGSMLPEDQLNQVYCEPEGIFSLNDELDYQYAFVNFGAAEKLFDMKGKVSALEIGCLEGQTDNVQEELAELLGPDYEIRNRYQLNDTLFKALETEKLATFIILAFILVIATFNIIGALTMLIIEKRRDIKTLYSLGADINLVRNIFMREGLLITGVGAFAGLLLGLFVCWLQIEFHLVKFGDAFIIPYYPVELQIMDFVRIFVLIMIIGFLAALYPVRVFTKMDIVRI